MDPYTIPRLLLTLAVVSAASAVPVWSGGEEPVTVAVPLRAIGGLDNGAAVAGTLVRTDATSGAVAIDLEAQGLPAGHAYTFWLAYFLTPGSCVAAPNAPDFTLRCGMPDLGATSPGAVVFANGAVADPDGSVHVTATIATGSCWSGPEAVAFPPQDGPFAGPVCLTGDLRGVEFQLVVRGHGPYDPVAFGAAQTTTLHGGCHAGEANYPCTDDLSSGFRHQLPLRCEDLSSDKCRGGWLD